MPGIISTRSLNAKELLLKVEAFRRKKAQSILPKVSVSKPLHLGSRKAKYRVAILDLGVTQSIIRQLEAAGFSITLLPYNTTSSEILRLKPHGLIISSGPEEDCGIKEAIENIKPLIKRLPILGVSSGHQVLAACLGAKINKLKVGHHGVNYPMQNPASYKGEITVQNHTLAVDADSLSKIKEVKITGYNLNDRTVEEFESKKLKLIGVQYTPASPGLGQINPVFKRFEKILGRSK
jgi:carbamoyl-phosphate synthase small subunit